MNMDRDRGSKKSTKLLSRDESSSTPTKSKKSEEMSPVTSNSDFLDLCGSPDFPSSQECFSVGWDWSGPVQGRKKPIVNVIQRPRRKRNEGTELLECQKTRRMRKEESEVSADPLHIFEELKSLSANSKRILETSTTMSSPIASPTMSLPRFGKDIPITPTSVKSHGKNKVSRRSLVGSSEAATSSSSSTNFPQAERQTSIVTCSNESGKENLDDLLDDSLGADILKHTQEVEQQEAQNQNNVECSRRKTRLSLCSKMNRNSPVSLKTRVNDVKDACTSKQETKTIEFDEFDEAALLSIGELEEKKICSQGQELRQLNNKIPSASAASGSKTGLDEDEDLLGSPDILDMIEMWEKNATQNSQDSNKSALPNPLQSTVQRSAVQSTSMIQGDVSRTAAINVTASHEQSRKRTLSLSKNGFKKCTPQEIEQKRQDAIKKRLQQKQSLK